MYGAAARNAKTLETGPNTSAKTGTAPAVATVAMDVDPQDDAPLPETDAGDAAGEDTQPAVDGKQASVSDGAYSPALPARRDVKSFKVSAHLAHNRIEDLSRDQMQVKLKERGLTQRGTKEECQTRLAGPTPGNASCDHAELHVRVFL